MKMVTTEWSTADEIRHVEELGQHCRPDAVAQTDEARRLRAVRLLRLYLEAAARRSWIGLDREACEKAERARLARLGGAA